MAVVEQNTEQEEIRRIKLPRKPQTFGLVTRKLGGSRMEVKCFDGKTRICRIPGRHRRRLWVREGDIIIVEPWEYSSESKGDVIYKYTRTQTGYLKRMGYLNKLKELEEF